MSEARYIRTLVVQRLDAYPDARVPLLALYCAMTAANLAYLRAHPNTPLLMRSGVVYAREAALDGPAEVLRDIPAILRDGWGDCDDLACWHAAELRHRGHAATPWIVPGGRAARFHVIVRVRDAAGRWRMSDPSAALGMHDRTGDPRHGYRRTQHGVTY
jgi:hypothetical protein